MSKTGAVKAEARRLAKRGRVAMSLIPPSEYREPLPKWASRAYRDKHFVVLINDKVRTTNGFAQLAYIVPNNKGRDVLWKDLQKIKNEIFGKEAGAIQYFPKESMLVNECNVYWLFVYPEGIVPEMIITEKQHDN